MSQLNFGEKIKFYLIFVFILLILAVIYVFAFTIFKFNKQEYKSVKINDYEFKLEIADTPLKRARGLAYRPALMEDEGMLFIFETPMIQRFWMKGMNFPIDILWLKDEIVIGFEENVQPEPGVKDEFLKIYSSPEPVDKVLELKAGSVEKLKIKVGTKVEFNNF